MEPASPPSSFPNLLLTVVPKGPIDTPVTYPATFCETSLPKLLAFSLSFCIPSTLWASGSLIWLPTSASQSLFLGALLAWSHQCLCGLSPPSLPLDSLLQGNHVLLLRSLKKEQTSSELQLGTGAWTCGTNSQFGHCFLCDLGQPAHL